MNELKQEVATILIQNKELQQTVQHLQLQITYIREDINWLRIQLAKTPTYPICSFVETINI